MKIDLEYGLSFGMFEWKGYNMKNIVEVFIPAKNWHVEIANAIKSTNPKNITRIVVRSHEERELGIIAHGRMCPENEIEFVIQ